MRGVRRKHLVQRHGRMSFHSNDSDSSSTEERGAHLTRELEKNMEKVIERILEKKKLVNPILS